MWEAWESCYQVSTEVLLITIMTNQSDLHRKSKSLCCGLQVLCDLKETEVTVASMMSISKGFYGECGRRGGYTELVNVNSDVQAEFYKLASINLCSNLNGQICMALVMNPPKVTHPPFATPTLLAIMSVFNALLQHK